MKYKRKKTRVSKYISSADDKASRVNKKRISRAALLFIICFFLSRIPLSESGYIKAVFTKSTGAFGVKSEELLDKTARYITDFCFGYLKNEANDDTMVFAKEEKNTASAGEKAPSVPEEEKAVFLPLIPYRGDITSEFGERVHPLSDEITFHNGIDIAANEGDEIKACFDGEVIISEYNEYSGNYIIISHMDGYTSSYAHMSKLLLGAGTKVKKGEVIGLAGSTGSATGPHLHFEIRKDGTPLDPYAICSVNE